jgi:hypothetical protein
MMNFVNYALERGGQIAPLLIPIEYANGPSLTNPSVLVLGDTIVVNLRNVNYTLYHAEKGIFEHKWGPLSYIHPENDITLRTTNIICALDPNLNILSYTKVDTSSLDVKPLWTFIGLEDSRLVSWNDKLYLSGVRRDLDTIGTGRMELSEIVVDGNTVKEVSRFRIPTPGDDSSYCEKNWMPVLDKPFEFVKWTNLTEVVKARPEKESCDTIFSGKFIPGYKDLRGSSQVIPWKGKRVCLVHEVDLYNSEAGRKNARYRHRFVVWDQHWNIETISPVLSFLNTEIEFCCGMDRHNDDFLITFGVQDNASYILKVSEEAVEEFIYG